MVRDALMTDGRMEGWTRRAGVCMIIDRGGMNEWSRPYARAMCRAGTK